MSSHLIVWESLMNRPRRRQAMPAPTVTWESIVLQAKDHAGEAIWLPGMAGERGDPCAELRTPHNNAIAEERAVMKSETNQVSSRLGMNAAALASDSKAVSKRISQPAAQMQMARVDVIVDSEEEARGRLEQEPGGE